MYIHAYTHLHHITGSLWHCLLAEQSLQKVTNLFNIFLQVILLCLQKYWYQFQFFLINCCTWVDFIFCGASSLSMFCMVSISVRSSARKASPAIVSVGLSKETSILLLIVIPSCWMSEIVQCVTVCAHSGSPSTMGFVPHLHLLDFVEFIVAGIQECQY